VAEATTQGLNSVVILNVSSIQRMSTGVGWLATLCIAAALAACGGGGSGNSAGNPPPNAPVILASLATLYLGGTSISNETNAAVLVEDVQTSTPITSAAVEVNNTPLSYVPADSAYEGKLSLAPGASVTVRVSINGATYTASGTNFSTFPAITSPATGITWVSDVSNTISWSGVAPDSSAQYAVGILNSGGSFAWPASGNYLQVASTQNSVALPAGSLSAGNYFLLVGIVDAQSFPNAARGSALDVAGFTYSALTVIQPPPAATLQSMAISPGSSVVGPGGTSHLAAIATYSDGTLPDVTSQASWSSSDTSKVTVSAGVVTGVAVGTATVTAQYQGLSANVPVTVFAPNPSPAPPLSEAVAFQIDYAHTGRATVGPDGPTFPPTAHWSATLGGTVISYPVIAGGRIFVTTDLAGTSSATALYALDETTGGIAWGPVALPGLFRFSAAAYDHGTVFVVTFEGLLMSFDAATGTPGWSTTLDSTGNSMPTAVNGIIYLNTAGGLVAVDEIGGHLLWRQDPATIYGSALAIVPDGVFGASSCEAVKLEPLSGALLWHYINGCVDGPTKTPVPAGGALYVRAMVNNAGPDSDNLLDAASGRLLGMFASQRMPSFSATTGFFLRDPGFTESGTLAAVSLATGTTLWTFTGDGRLTSAPVVIDNVVVVGSLSGNVYALDAAGGSVLWSGSTGAPIAVPDESNGNITSGLGAGDGYLVVPAGNVLNAWRVVP
jgi:outer membrane protein assembly factor BamB